MFSLAALLSWWAVMMASRVAAFSFLPTSGSTTFARSSAIVQMSDDQPSDSSSEDLFDTAYDVKSEAFEPTEAELRVTSVMDELPASMAISGEAEFSSERRAKINEALLRLEAVNPTENRTTSPLLNGVWSLRYAGGYSPDWTLPSPTRQLALFLYSGGYSPGLFALSLAQKLPAALVDVGDLEIQISRDNLIEAKVAVKLFGGSENEVVVRARLAVESDVRLKETYEGATVLGQNIDLPDALQYSRELFVTYLDEDLLVVRDSSGVPEVLVRKI